MKFKVVVPIIKGQTATSNEAWIGPSRAHIMSLGELNLFLTTFMLGNSHDLIERFYVERIDG